MEYFVRVHQSLNDIDYTGSFYTGSTGIVLGKSESYDTYEELARKKIKKRFTKKPDAVLSKMLTVKEWDSVKDFDLGPRIKLLLHLFTQRSTQIFCYFKEIPHPNNVYREEIDNHDLIGLIFDGGTITFDDNFAVFYFVKNLAEL